MKINIDYVAGVLDSKGGFYLFRGGGKYDRFLGFKIVTLFNKDSIEKSIQYLKQLNIHFGSYYCDYLSKRTKIYYISSLHEMKKLLQFMKDYCLRTDYQKFKYNKKKGWYIPEVKENEN